LRESGKRFERNETISEHEAVKPQCPKCGSKKGHLRAGPCFCGDIQEELKDSEELWSSAAGSDRMDRQHTEAARTTTGTTAAAEATTTTARKVTDRAQIARGLRFTDASNRRIRTI